MPVEECKRCGTCCKKGGPCFHIEDKDLINKGAIPVKYLYTIRKGQMTFDNVRGRLMPATSDIIKMKSQNGFKTCIFYSGEGCAVYEDRPLECRTLKCWDTDQIERIYSKNRLTRKDLIEGIEGLWDLAENHQAQCSYEKIRHQLDAMDDNNKKNTFDRILEVIRYDAHLRSMVAEKGGMEPEMADFLFGRPLWETIKGFGLKVEKKGGRDRLVEIKEVKNTIDEM